MPPTKITLVPHTHWDREWYEPFDRFSKRLVAMMDTLIDVGTAGFPHFHLDGQTAMVDDYLTVRPECEPQIRRLAADGRLSVGPWVAQMDEFLVSGESHVRNLEMGLARARELGPALEIGYLPDQFGHIGQMPQILRGAGLDRAVVWRGVPRAIERDAFWWEAPDGSRVLTEYLAFGYSNAQVDGASFDQIQDPERLADAMERSVERQRSFMASDRMLVMLGYDHAGPDTTFPERLSAARPFLRTVEPEIGGLAEHLFAQRLRADPPTWRGELRSSARAHLLPNVYSARVHQKRERGKVEGLLERYAEPLAALVPEFEWPEPDLSRAWTLLLWNGAHDSACGCSHDQVAIDVDARYAEARSIAGDIIEAAMRALGARVSQPGVIRFNPSSFAREGVPALGWCVDPASAVASEMAVDVRDGADGAFTADGVEFLLLDERDVGDLYNFCYAEEGQVPWAPAENRVVDQTVTSVFDERLEVEVRVSRREEEPFLRLDGVIRNARPDHRLRLHVTLGRQAGGSLAASPFELVSRPLVGEGSDVEVASSTWPASGVALAGDVAVFGEGVFEYEVVEGHELVVTLLRCVGTISRPALATRPWAAGPDVPTPDAQMLGETAFSLGVWQPADRAGLLAGRERFALPLVSGTARGGGSLPATGSLLEVAGGAELSSVRKVNDEVQVRLWNPHDDEAVEAIVAGSRVRLGPAKILTITVA